MTPLFVLSAAPRRCSHLPKYGNASGSLLHHVLQVPSLKSELRAILRRPSFAITRNTRVYQSKVCFENVY